MPKLDIHHWNQEDINLYWDVLSGSLVVCTPRLGEDLLVWIEKSQWVNLGPITQVALEEGSGHGFLVRTNRFGERGELFVWLAPGVRATARLPMEGVRV